MNQIKTIIYLTTFIVYHSLSAQEVPDKFNFKNLKFDKSTNLLYYKISKKYPNASKDVLFKSIKKWVYTLYDDSSSVLIENKELGFIKTIQVFNISVDFSTSTYCTYSWLILNVKDNKIDYNFIRFRPSKKLTGLDETSPFFYPKSNSIEMYIFDKNGTIVKSKQEYLTKLETNCDLIISSLDQYVLEQLATE